MMLPSQASPEAFGAPASKPTSQTAQRRRRGEAAGGSGSHGSCLVQWVMVMDTYNVVVMVMGHGHGHSA